MPIPLFVNIPFSLSPRMAFRWAWFALCRWDTFRICAACVYSVLYFFRVKVNVFSDLFGNLFRRHQIYCDGLQDFRVERFVLGIESWLILGLWFCNLSSFVEDSIDQHVEPELTACCWFTASSCEVDVQSANFREAIFGTFWSGHHDWLKISPFWQFQSTLPEQNKKNLSKKCGIIASKGWKPAC